MEIWNKNKLYSPIGNFKFEKLDFLLETLIGLMKKSHNDCIDWYKALKCLCQCGDVTEKDQTIWHTEYAMMDTNETKPV